MKKNCFSLRHFSVIFFGNRGKRQKFYHKIHSQNIHTEWANWKDVICWKLWHLQLIKSYAMRFRWGRTLLFFHIFPRNINSSNKMFSNLFINWFPLSKKSSWMKEPVQFFCKYIFFALKCVSNFFSRQFRSTIKKKVHKRGTENVLECLATRELHVIISLHNATCIETR